ncbi:glycoside hydrolase family 36 protein [uncultured Alistipes sp.]|uniref:glycoside hydrolase family 36 protein n=1 Tax=uncultured Alistipes sp. TaxID=538949 RepID=UPI002603828F|nr:glycoside hydrolase family 36 protein [uncultured Alistipes sp.]
MKRFFAICSIWIWSAAFAGALSAQAVSKVTSAPVDAVRWVETRFGPGKVPPFSFVYGGKSSRELLRQWKYRASRPESPEPGVEAFLYSYTDPVTGLVADCRVWAYPEFHAVKWELRFTNGGGKNSPTLEKVKVADIGLQYPSAGEFMLYRADGNHISKEDFHPRATALAPGETFRMAPEGGRSSEGDHLPFFNIAAPGGRQGVTAAVGWTGTWFADITATGDRGVELASGMKNMELYLLPGETIRTPSFSLLFWQGDDRMEGHNRFRRYVLAHHSRKIDGKFAEYPLCSGFNYRDPAPCTEYSCITADWACALISRYAQFGLTPEVFWLDAGWNEGAADYAHGRSWANTTGNWTIDSTRFPQGLKPVADAAHRVGAKFMVWFEPERVIKGTQWAVEHPEWMLDLPSEPDGTYLLFDLGNTEAREWLSRYIGDMIEQNGIDYYRQDFNMQPDKYWAAHDEPGRKGMKEIRHIEGLYAFWDYLLERFPGLLIDNCASGGRRIDLETIARSAPLWRSDYYHYDDPDGYQGHTYGLNFFLPLHGTGILQTDKYSFRSSISSALIYNWKVTDKNVSFLDMQDRIDEFKSVRDYFYEDYYPLTGIERTTSDSVWIAYQMHRPSDGTGIVVAFRREACPDASVRVALSGLDPRRRYLIVDTDSGVSQQKTGAELAAGFDLLSDEPRTSLLLRYAPAE